MRDLAFFDGQWTIKCECGGDVSLCAYCVQASLPSYDDLVTERKHEENLRYRIKMRYGKARVEEIVSTRRKHPSRLQ